MGVCDNFSGRGLDNLSGRSAADRSGSPLGELAPEASEGGGMGNGGRPPGGNLETGNFYGRIQRVIDSSNRLALSPLPLSSLGGE